VSTIIDIDVHIHKQIQPRFILNRALLDLTAAVISTTSIILNSNKTRAGLYMVH